MKQETLRNELMYELREFTRMAHHNAQYIDAHEDFCEPNVIDYDVVEHLRLVCHVLVQLAQLMQQ